MGPIEISIIVAVAIYMLLMFVYFGRRISKGKGLEDCSCGKKKGSDLVKAFYKENKK